jgi:TonB family protein
MPEMKASVVPPKADFPTASVTAPKLINGPRPMFPAAANAMHVTSDTVVLNAKVMTNGKIGDISVVRGNPVFVQAVKEAVKHWQYTPAQLNHQPTESTIEIVFKFGQGS